MAKKKHQSLDFPPFPELHWDDYFWTTSIQLQSWAGYQDRSGPYGAKGGAKKSNGQVRLTIDVLSSGTKSDPTPEQTAAYSHLLRHQKKVQKAIMLQVLEKYLEYRKAVIAEYELDEADNPLPIIKRPQQLKEYVGLSSVFIHTVAKDGIAYIGYGLGCAWEGEHGLGAMLHMDRVVEVGHADVGILSWIATRDARPPKKKRQSAPRRGSRS